MKQMNVIPTPFAPTLKARMFVAVKVDFPGMVITALVCFPLYIICMMHFCYAFDSILVCVNFMSKSQVARSS